MIAMRKKRYIHVAIIALVIIPSVIAVFITALQNYLHATVFSMLLNGPLSLDDPELLSYIRSSVLVPPASGDYNLRILDPKNPANTNYNSYLNSTIGFPPLHRIVKAIFDDHPSGFFIEAGALDGEYLSNTLYLEKDKGWTGLLVEPDTEMFAHLLKKNRKAWAANCCLATETYPNKKTLVKLSNSKGPGDDIGYRAMNSLLSSRYVTIGNKIARQSFEQIQCVPLQSLLKALEITHVDFLSLDIEGIEEDVVETFLMNRKGLEVDVWLVEHHNPNVAMDERDNFFIKRFTLRGYTLYTIMQDTRPFNYVFVRNESLVYKSAFSRRPQEFVVD